MASGPLVVTCSPRDRDTDTPASSCSPPLQTQERIVVYSPSQPDGEQVVVCSSPHPKEQTIIFRPFQAQGVRTVALRQYQEQIERTVAHASFQTQEQSPPTSSEERQDHGSSVVTWRPHETVCSSSGIQTSPAAPVVQIISQSSTPEHQPPAVEIELDVDLLKTWPSHHRYYQQ